MRYSIEYIVVIARVFDEIKLSDVAETTQFSSMLTGGFIGDFCPGNKEQTTSLLLKSTGYSSNKSKGT